MTMPPYPVVCFDCAAPAAFKIAARWSDGLTRELKTYSLCCAKCVARRLSDARQRHAACPLSADEMLDPPMVFEYCPGQRDPALKRRADLE